MLAPQFNGVAAASDDKACPRRDRPDRHAVDIAVHDVLREQAVRRREAVLSDRLPYSRQNQRQNQRRTLSSPQLVLKFHCAPTPNT